jgi:hypothetical protein
MKEQEWEHELEERLGRKMEQEWEKIDRHH